MKRFLPICALPVCVLLGAASYGPALAAPIPAPKSKELAVADPQTLVLRGKMPPFYDPRDLSKPPVLSAKSVVVMDADTGQILWERNGAQRRAPASTTKILTGLLFAEHTPPDQIITCMDPKIERFEGSSLHLKPWEKLSAKDLLYGLMLRSANDGAVVIAQHVAGSVPQFAALMNQRARELGATDTHFTNPNGLPDPKHYTTARDLARIARAALADPRFADAVGTYRRRIQRSKQTRDVLLVAKSKKFFRKFPGADGVKTGYTRAAGYCFVGSATRDGRRLLSVVLGATNSATADTIPLLSWAFRRFPQVQIARRGETVGTVAVHGGADPEVPVMAADDLHASTDRLAPVRVQKKVEAIPLSAPVRAGQKVGRLVARIDGAPIASVPLLAASDVGYSPVAAATRSWAGPGILLAGGAFLLLGVRVGTTASKGTRRRRRRVAAARRGDDRRW